MTTAKELRDKSVEELQGLYQDCLKELFLLKNKMKGTAKPENPHLVPITRRQIARLLTVITEKQAMSTHNETRGN